MYFNYFSKLVSVGYFQVLSTIWMSWYIQYAHKKKNAKFIFFLITLCEFMFVTKSIWNT